MNPADFQGDSYRRDLEAHKSLQAQVPTSYGAAYDHRGKTLKRKVSGPADTENADCLWGGEEGWCGCWLQC